MEPRSSPPSAPSLRAFVAARVAGRGLRSVARDIGLHQSGLKYFLEGGMPRRATLRKLQDWYVRVLLSDPDAPAGDAEALALSALLRDLPSAARDEAWRESVAFYRALYQRSGAPEPLWLRTLDAPH